MKGGILMLGTIDWPLLLAIILFLIGFILIGIEMLAPGISVPGIAGTVCLIIGIFIAADTIEEGIIITIIILILLGIMLAIILSILTKGKLKSPIILKEEQNKDKGYISSGDLNYLLGKRGIAASDLRPTGTGDFDGIELDVISEGKYILKGTKLIIDKVQGSKLIVKIDD
jgi:membrane-bound ClpP family serine protease